MIHDCNITSDRLKNLTSLLSELMDIRKSYKKCDELTCNDINALIFDLYRS